MYAALPGTHPVLSSTAVYTLTTTATRNPALILAAGVMGTLFGYQRRATHGLRAPAHPPNLVHTDGDPTATDLQAGRSTIQEGLVSTPPARCDPVHQWCRDTAAAHSVASTLNPAHPSHLRRLTTIRQQAPRGASRKANPRAVHRTRSAGLSAGCLGGKGSADLALSGVCRIAVVGLY